MRRAVVAGIALIGVAAAAFGLGYLAGHNTAVPPPRAAPSVLPPAVKVPRVLHLPMTNAVQMLLRANLAIGKVQTRTRSEPGTIVAQFPIPGTSASPGAPVNLFVSTSVYPRGAFESCPSVPGTLFVESGQEEEAKQVALRFSQAFLSDDWRTVRDLVDPAALPLRNDHWALAGEPGRVTVGAFSAHDHLVAYGCGRDVAERSVAVALDDGTSSASADFNLYLVRRTGGWKVWASY